MLRVPFSLLLLMMMTAAAPAGSGDREAGGDDENGAPRSGGRSESIELPRPDRDGELTVEQALERRRSVREYSDEPLTFAELGQLLWAAQGITEPRRGFRAAPSAGATFPMEVYAAAGDVDELPAGLYRYVPDGHRLVRVAEGDHRPALFESGLRQAPLAEAPLVLAFTAVVERTASRYGARAERYVQIEAGHLSQNIYLQCEALGLATVAIGAFHDDELSRALALDDGERPLYLMPVGRRR